MSGVHCTDELRSGEPRGGQGAEGGGPFDISSLQVTAIIQT